MVILPPKLEELSAGTELIAGMGKSTILADFDFETYSPAGFVFNNGKWTTLPGASKKGLPAIGMARYTEHPDAEVLSLAYDLKDGHGAHLWRPGLPNPKDLFEHVISGKLLEAWNCAFEYLVWTNICIRKYDWPCLSYRQLRDAMAKAHAYSLPGALADAGEVIGSQIKKDKEGARLLKKFSIPRDQTKSDSRLRILPCDDPIDAQKLYDYNLTDIKAEAAISSRVPDLPPSELEFWLCDQDINRRGVSIDLEAINAGIKIIDQAMKKYNEQLCSITHGEVRSAAEVLKLTKWINSQGVHILNLQQETIDTILQQENLPSNVRRALEIRNTLNSAAIKKLYSMRNYACEDGRIYDLFVYHKARTGRAAGVGPQLHNFPNSGLVVFVCNDCKKHMASRAYCPWCGSFNRGAAVEWNDEATEEALQTIKTGSLEYVELFWKDALGAISSCLRGMIIAKSGHQLIGCDYNSIEAIVLAAIAGEEWRLEVFRTHGKIYEMSASKITGVSFEEFERHKRETGQHHILRKKVGKVAELACFTADTQVLTKRGYINIKDVLITDQLWDGIEWINHKGIILKGKRKTICVDGVKMTPTHPISLGDSWTAANQLVLNENILCRALEIGSENLPLNMFQEQKFQSRVLVRKKKSILSRFQIYMGRKVLVVINALNKKVRKHYLKIIGSMNLLFQISSIEEGCLIDSVPQFKDVIILKRNNSTIMEKEELQFLNYGEKKEKNFLDMLLRLKDGMTQIWKWIELMLTEGMNREILSSSLDKKIQKIKEKFKIWKKKSLCWNNVYDIVNAGPRHRFTIKTNSGHFIVHNSGYQGWIGAWKQFGADEFFDDEQIKQAILAWRAASPSIVMLWAKLEYAAQSAVLNPGMEYEVNDLITYIMRGDALYCKLPSERYLIYHRPRLIDAQAPREGYQLTFESWNTNAKYGSSGWIRMPTYGGKLTENIVQAIARDILANAIVNLEKEGYPVIMHVHDEIVLEVPIGTVTVEMIEKIMTQLPFWCWTWPIRASGGWSGQRYRK